ncbi:response regulator [Bizionia argentinensis JUB59]|uniref:Response regulator n=1 Tax=Bizionia argentinensis JUB59 TaxID=1046627 RepID=G2EAP7_9FLAO|nr:response regulator [Bizionia argentinensis]EGV44482.1 response regulator [Bizionia argentinensis JUB59]
MSPKNLNIVFVDNDEDDRALFEEALGELKINCSLKLFESGNELMRYLNQTDKETNVLFLDLNMPIKSGIECLIEIKREKKLKNIPVIIYSTSSAEKDIEDTFGHGASVYIKKPNNFTELKNLIYNVLQVNWKDHNSNLNRQNFLFTI